MWCSRFKSFLNLHSNHIFYIEIICSKFNESSLVSYQDEETVGGEVLMSWDGWEHGEDQAAEHQDEPKWNNIKKETLINIKYTLLIMSFDLCTHPMTTFPVLLSILLITGMCTKMELTIAFSSVADTFWHWRTSRTLKTGSTITHLISSLQWNMSLTIIEFPEISS